MAVMIEKAVRRKRSQWALNQLMVSEDAGGTDFAGIRRAGISCPTYPDMPDAIDWQKRILALAS
jgi:hypothetical protein